MSPNKERVGLGEEDKSRSLFPHPLLRREAQKERESADRYTAFAMMFTCAAIAAVIPLLPKFPFIAFLSVPLLLIISGARQAMFAKHRSSHRNRGFELFWSKTQKDTEADPRLIDLSYEEAQRAFSIVAPIFTDHLYEHGTLFGELRLKRPFARESGRSRWYVTKPRPRWLTSQQSELLSSVRLLHLMMGLAAAPILIASIVVAGIYFSDISIIGLEYSPALPIWIYAAMLSPLGIYVGVHVLTQIRQDYGHLDELEYGLYSPHSMPVLWHAVAKAHLEVKAEHVGDASYATALTRKALDVASRVDDIFQWFEDRRIHERMVLDDSVERAVALQINFAKDRDDLFSPPLLLDPFRAELLDLSVDGSGLGVYANLAYAEAFVDIGRLEPGAEVTLNLPEGSGVGDIPLKGELKNITSLGDHKWRMGIAIESRCQFHHCIHHVESSQPEAGEEIGCVMCDNYLVQQWYHNQLESPDIPIN